MKLHLIVLTVAAAALSIGALPAPKTTQSRTDSAPVETTLPDLLVTAERTIAGGATGAVTKASQSGDLPDVVVVAEGPLSTAAPLEFRIQGGDLPDVTVFADRPARTSAIAADHTVVTSF
ncbi:MAG TPA: hypothetical protein P5179_01075 [Candidatus Latescibacteria bacterium]|nr:hypothetical protein [Candidatus Latescibacterota bacterium]HQE60846.1 hypothetical protein [Candidatus Latescibacterota bacterium]HRS93846.1 hypothetical protein [Candidatus Latescibacterota bacterium]